jgi:hypothetical protein
MNLKRLGTFGVVLVSIAFPTTCAIAQNVFHGTCAELPDYIANTGVVDENTTPHPGKAGWTNADWPFSVTYTSQHRVPGSRKGVCFSAIAHIRFEAHCTTTTIQWDPVGCDPCACKAERDAWQTRLANHEQIHVQEAQAMADKLTREFPSFEVTACSPFPTATWESVKEQFDMQALHRVMASKRVNKKKRDWSDSQDRFDDLRTSFVGRVEYPNCTKCNVCAPGEQPACKECPAGKILYKGECVTPKPCGPLVKPAGIQYYQNCGLQGPPGQQETVQCCNFHQPGGYDIWACNPAPYGSGGCADPGPNYP